MTDYPHLTEIEPGPVQDAIRTLWDGLSELEGRLDGLAAAASLSEVREALQVGGSHQLDVTGLLGRLLQPQPARIAVGMWQQIGNETGAGNFVWDKELLNTAPEVYVRRNSNTEIHLRKGGTFLAIAALRVSASAAMSLHQNADNRARSVADLTTTLSQVLLAAAGDRVYCTNGLNDRIGAIGTQPPTTLALIRLS